MIIWLASYPRSGNTLLRMMLHTTCGVPTYSKHNDADIASDANASAQAGHRNFEGDWLDAYKRMSESAETFFVKTHDAPEDAAKAIYVVRDGASTCVSYYHYAQNYPDPAFGLSMLDIIAGFTHFGSWGSHLDAWNPMERKDTLFLRYEDLVERPEEQVARIARFCGLNVIRPYVNDFESLHQANPRFFRQGSSGSSRSKLQDEEAELFELLHGDWMQRLGYEKSNCDGPSNSSLRRHFAQRGQQLLHSREFEHRHEADAARLRNQCANLLRRLDARNELIAEMKKRIEAANARADLLQQDNRKVRQALDRAVDSHRRQEEAIKILQRRVDGLSRSRVLRAAWGTRIAKRPPWLNQFPPDVPKPLQPAPPEPQLPAAPEVPDLSEKREPVFGQMQIALEHLKAKGFDPRVVLDIGAAKGYWSDFASYVFPQAEFFMLDPLEESRPALEAMAARNAKMHPLIIAAGREGGSMKMNITPDADGSSLCDFPNADRNRQREVRIETVDGLLEEGRIKPPQLVKIDVQGWEMEVLAGAKKLFESAEVFIIEVNLFKFTPQCPLAHEVVEHMAHNGYRVYDWAGMLRRPFEDDLGQMDLVFVSRNSQLIASNRWI